jgi:hypothetical protein
MCAGGKGDGEILNINRGKEVVGGGGDAVRVSQDTLRPIRKEEQEIPDARP